MNLADNIKQMFTLNAWKAFFPEFDNLGFEYSGPWLFRKVKFSVSYLLENLIYAAVSSAYLYALIQYAPISVSASFTKNLLGLTITTYVSAGVIFYFNQKSHFAEKILQCIHLAAGLLAGPAIMLIEYLSIAITAILASIALPFAWIKDWMKGELYKDCTVMLTHAVINANAKQVELLIQEKADVNATDDQGASFLAMAASHGFIKVVEALLKAPNIDINSQDVFGWSPLMRAITHSHKEVIELLLQSPNINVNTQTNHDLMTPLMYAAKIGNASIVSKLIQVPNINLNAANLDKHTALMLAAQNGHDRVVDILLQAPGIELNYRDTHNQRAIELTKTPIIKDMIQRANTLHLLIPQAYQDLPNINCKANKQ